MNSIQFQASSYYPRTQAQPNAHFSGWLRKSKPAADTVEKTANSGKFIQGSIWQGAKRALKMTLLRPRGWAELALAIVSHGIINFPVIHFIEGFIGANSIWKKRQLGWIVVNKNEFGGRTLVEAFKDLFTNFSFRKKK